MHVIQPTQGFTYSGIDADGIAECREGGMWIDQIIVVVVLIACSRWKDVVCHDVLLVIYYLLPASSNICFAAWTRAEMQVVVWVRSVECWMALRLSVKFT